MISEYHICVCNCVYLKQNGKEQEEAAGVKKKKTTMTTMIPRNVLCAVHASKFGGVAINTCCCLFFYFYGYVNGAGIVIVIRCCFQTCCFFDCFRISAIDMNNNFFETNDDVHHV